MAYFAMIILTYVVLAAITGLAFGLYNLMLLNKINAEWGIKPWGLGTLFGNIYWSMFIGCFIGIMDAIDTKKAPESGAFLLATHFLLFLYSSVAIHCLAVGLQD